MIAHIVLFKPLVSLSPEQRQVVLGAVKTAVTRCPSVRSCRAGRRVKHGLPGYEQTMRDDYEYVLMLEFDDVAGLREYLTHPEHSRIGGFFTSAASSSLAYDYDLQDLSAADQIV
jgi:Stress responsive A/B Barrel Domain